MPARRRSASLPAELPDATAAEELVEESVLAGTPADAVTVHSGAVEAGTEGRSSRRRLRLAAWIAIAWLGLVVFCAVFASVLPIDDPQAANAAIARQGPSTSHPFGVDGNGRDVMSRVIFGSRASLEIGVGAVLLGLIVGGLFGLVAGYFKGRIASVIAGLLDVLLAFPQLVLALSLVAFLGQTTRNITLALGIVAIPILARITRASALSWSEREFVLAARAQGARHTRIMFRELLPNVLPAMLSIAILGIAVAIVAEGGLAILGVGVKLPTPSWGNIIADGTADLNDAPHIVLAPSIVIFFTVLSLNYLGDVIRARFDVRESGL